MHADLVHSNIHLANENARVLFGASISIESEELHTCTAFIDYDSDDERAVPHSPTNFFHSFGYLKSSLTDLGDQYCCKEGCITGLASKLDISYGKTNMASSHFKSHDRMCETEIIISSDFAPGSIIVYETWAATQEDGRDNVAEQVLCGLGISEDTSHLESMINMGRELQWSNRNWYSSLEEIPAELRDAVKGLSMTDINMLVYRSASEDKDTGISDAAYEIPGLGVNAYCGIQGFVTVLQNFVSLNDMGHSLCSNLRGGDWMIDYIIGRMDKLSKMMPSIELSHKWLKSQLSLVKRVSISLKPKYFAMIVLSYYHAIRCKALIGPLEKFGRNLSTESTFDIILQSSIMTTYQLYGSVRSSGLFPKPYPGKLYVNDRPKFPEGWGEPCLAAGLPHFATEYLRCWGRDTFVALNGLLILPGFYDAARVHIIAFGSTIRHGLVPNLLDSGVRPRYNARDATWFWMKSVSDYCSKSPEGFAFLDTVVHRRFIPASQSTDKDADTHVDPSNSKVFEQTSKISELCQEILERHAIGIEFREYQAGGSLDHAMQSEGFNISINTDFDQGGFVSGGNRYNCGNLR